jgi:hypothetical protein
MFFSSKDPFQKWCCATKRIYARPWPFSCKKSHTYPRCLFLTMHFPRDANMGQHKKKLVKNSNMFQLSVYSLIYKSA